MITINIERITDNLKDTLKEYERVHKQQLESLQYQIDMYKKNWESEAKRAVLYGKVLDKNGIKRPKVGK